MSNSILYRAGKWRNRSYSLIGGFTDITSLYDCLMVSRSGIAVFDALVSCKLMGRKPLYISTDRGSRTPWQGGIFRDIWLFKWGYDRRKPRQIQWNPIKETGWDYWPSALSKLRTSLGWGCYYKRLVFFEIYLFQALSNDFYNLYPPFTGSLLK